jgi:RpiB/LacA/LacB family sugar-phosphate isomerase
MKIAIAADHAGFVLKQSLCERLRAAGHEVADYGPPGTEPVDYPDFAAAVARHVAGGTADRGILVCSTGVGMSIAANKVAGVRAALGTSVDEVRLVREHNDANVLTLGSRFTAEPDAAEMVETFLATPFAGGRHARRVAKIAELDRQRVLQELS